MKGSIPVVSELFLRVLHMLSHFLGLSFRSISLCQLLASSLSSHLISNADLRAVQMRRRSPPELVDFRLDPAHPWHVMRRGDGGKGGVKEGGWKEGEGKGAAGSRAAQFKDLRQ